MMKSVPRFGGANKERDMNFYEPAIAPDKLSQEPVERVSLRKQLSSWCRAPSPQAEIMTITPDLAILMLERNPDYNRSRNDRIAASYGREMKESRMMLTNQGIGFDTNGQLVDGQHRLMACVASGQSFESIVVFGLDPKAFMYVDTNYRRTAGHKVHIAGFPNGNNLAAAVRIVLLVEMSDISLRQSRAGGMYPKNRVHGEIPHEFIVDFLNENPGFVEMRKWYQTYGRLRAISKSTLHAAHWMLHQKHPKLANIFMEQLCLGESLNRSENVYRLREHLINLHASRERLSKTWQLVWMIDAFNDTRRGKTTKFVMTDRDFPKVLS